MFNNTRGGGHAHVATITASEVAAATLTSDAAQPATTGTGTEKKKTTKKDELDSLCDAYYKAYSGEKCNGIVNHDPESVKETFKEIVECKVKTKNNRLTIRLLVPCSCPRSSKFLWPPRHL